MGAKARAVGPDMPRVVRTFIEHLKLGRLQRFAQALLKQTG